MFSSRSAKEFYIDLQDNRYYNPGETIRGDVVLDLAKPTKVNQIRVVFAGSVQVGSNVLSLFSRECQIATEPGGVLQLEAKSNRFPFEINIPAESAELPTSMKVGAKNDNAAAASVRYTLSASLHRPFIPQAMAPQDTRDIAIVEPIDVSLTQYDHPVPAKQEDGKVVLGGTSFLASIPKAAYVRGDIMSVMVTVQGDHEFSKKHAIRIGLVRRIYFCWKGRRELVKWEDACKAVKVDVDLDQDTDFTQKTTAKIYLPPSLAPTTRASGRILRVEYSVRVSLDINQAAKGTQEWKQSFELSKDLPILIGTTPKADISIDDDDEEEDVDEDTESGEIPHDGIEVIDESGSATLVSNMANMRLCENHEGVNGSPVVTPPAVVEDTKSALEESRDGSSEGHHSNRDQDRHVPESNSDLTPDPEARVPQLKNDEGHNAANGNAHYNHLPEQSEADSAPRSLPSHPHPNIYESRSIGLGSEWEHLSDHPQAHGSDLARSKTVGSASASTYYSGSSEHDWIYHTTPPIMKPLHGDGLVWDNNTCTSPLVRQNTYSSSQSSLPPSSPYFHPPLSPHHLNQSATTILGTSPQGGGFRMPVPEHMSEPHHLNRAATTILGTSPQSGGFRMPVPEPHHSTPLTVPGPPIPTPFVNSRPPPLPSRSSPSSPFVQMPSAPSFLQQPQSPQPHYHYQ